MTTITDKDLDNWLKVCEQASPFIHPSKIAMVVPAADRVRVTSQMIFIAHDAMPKLIHAYRDVKAKLDKLMGDDIVGEIDSGIKEAKAGLDGDLQNGVGRGTEPT